MPASSHADFRLALLLRVVSVFLFLLAGMAAVAQDPTEIEFRQALKDMSNDLRLMCVAAHPDDEDGATLAYYRYKHGVKTYALLGTRGEGGQNEIGPELYEDLAVIRTKEMMEAARIEGAELHFLDMPEFGFSKTIEETLEKWGKDVLLEKMVRKIREIRPHVIITHHGRMKDHGHHQAIGWAVQEAFTVAADANAFPESGKPWQVQRLYIRDFTGESKEAVVVDINEKDELRGKTYAEIAADALRAHKSQGMEQFIERLLSGEAKAYYDLVKEKPLAKGIQIDDNIGDLYKGIHTSYGIHLIEYSVRNRDEWLELLFAELQSIREADEQLLKDGVSFRRDTTPLFQAMALASGVSVTGKLKDEIIVPGQTIELDLTFQNQGLHIVDASHRLHQLNCDCGADPTGVPFTSTDDKPNTMTLRFSEYGLTIPTSRHQLDRYFLRPSISIKTHLTLASRQRMMFDTRFYNDVAPPVLPEFVGAPYLLNPKNPRIPWFINSDPFGPSRCRFAVRLTNYTPGPHEQEVRFTAPVGWSIEVNSIGDEHLSMDAANSVAFNVKFVQEDQQVLANLSVVAPQEVETGPYPISIATAGLDFTPTAVIEVVDLKLDFPETERPDQAECPEGNVRSIGLIDSYDTTISDTIEKLDTLKLTLERIDPATITPDRLKCFDVIVVDMRAYAKRPDLKANNAALLEWCKRGGTLIVNYHKTFDWSPDFAPYPISLSNNRVTREDAPVKLLVPEHPWFNTPNKITPEDWDGWRQERGLYFPQKWDDAYTPLIETTDPDEVIPPGSCLIADYGEGKYFYTSLVWYRQLRELHPGALKLFANMLAL